MKITGLVFKTLIGLAIFSGFLTVSSKLSRSQSEKPEIRPAWNPEKEILIAAAVPVSGQSLQLEMPKFVAKMTGQVTLPKLSPPALLTHRELQVMVNYLDYEIFLGRGVRFRYSDLPDDPMGHMWFLKRPRDLRGKTIRIDYRGIVPDEMIFKIARSGTSASVTRKVRLESSPYEPKSIFIDIPDRFPFKDVKYFEFWIDRESAGRRHGDFTIDQVVILEATEKAKMQAVPPEESRPDRFPFDQPFIPTNLMRTEVPVS